MILLVLFLNEPSTFSQGPCALHAGAAKKPVPQADQVLRRIRDSQGCAEKLDQCGDDEEIEIGDTDPVDCILAEERAAGKDSQPQLTKATDSILNPSNEDELTDDTSSHPLAPKPDRLTLPGALRVHDSFEAAQDDLARLLAFMRMAPDGCDADVVPKPMLTRKLVMQTPRRWHDMVRHQLSHAQALDSLPAQRRSRISAWVEQIEKARDKVAPSLPSNVKIATGDIVAVKHRGAWQAGCIFTFVQGV